jgi:hypothetical protein
VYNTFKLEVRLEKPVITIILEDVIMATGS